LLDNQNIGGRECQSCHMPRIKDSVILAVDYTFIGVVLDSIGDTLFSSGTWDSNFELTGHDLNFEPHYDVINQGNQVQVYEMVFADVNGDKTTVLERGASLLKDNRIPPLGFTSGHISYDTAKIAGMALIDPNFNTVNNIEGSGKDFIQYHVGLSNYLGNLNTICKVFYQAAPPAWMTPMFSFNSVEIDRFKDMFDTADRTPVLMQENLIGDLFLKIPELTQNKFKIYPNPAQSFLSFRGIDSSDILNVEVFSLTGQHQNSSYSSGNVYIDLPPSTYILRLTTKENRTIVRKFIVAF